MKFASRDNSLDPEQGLLNAYELFANGHPEEAAMMFLAYGDIENDIGVATETEYTLLAEHLTEVLANVALYNLIISRQVLPVLNDDMEPAYKPSPWCESD